MRRAVERAKKLLASGCIPAPAFHGYASQGPSQGPSQGDEGDKPPMVFDGFYVHENQLNKMHGEEEAALQQEYGSSEGVSKRHAGNIKK